MKKTEIKRKGKGECDKEDRKSGDEQERMKMSAHSKRVGAYSEGAKLRYGEKERPL